MSGCKPSVLKTDIPSGIKGSNPFFSAVLLVLTTRNRLAFIIIMVKEWIWMVKQLHWSGDMSRKHGFGLKNWMGVGSSIIRKIVPFYMVKKDRIHFRSSKRYCFNGEMDEWLKSAIC